MATTSINKRRRTTTHDGSPHNISDLPLGFLVDVSAYLSQPSRALFAVAMTAPSSSWSNVNVLQHQPSETSQTIISPSSQWQKLDFFDIDKSLANRLTDNDICAMLKCVNAKETVRILKLTGLVNITGGGLEPLRDSTILEQIDFSLLNPVLDILYSMIETSGCSLRYVHFPLNQGNLSVSESERRAFFRRFAEHLNNCHLDCSKCAREIGRRNTSWWILGAICYECLKPICHDCGESNGRKAIEYCDVCHKEYCADCVHVNWCDICDSIKCIPCAGDMKECRECERNCCGNCMHSIVCDNCERGLTLGDY